MGIYKTAMGKGVDMTSLAAKNELTRAVGNAKLNARGDTIDANGQIVKTMPARVNEMYSQTVGSKSAQPRQQHSSAYQSPAAPKINPKDLNPI